MPDQSPLSLRDALAKQLRLTRLRHRLTQEKLAFLSGLHRNHVSLLERGLRSPTVDVLYRITSALGVKASSLLASAEGRTKSEKSNG